MLPSADEIDRLASVVADKGLEKMSQRLKWPLLLVAVFATYTGYNAWSDFNSKIGAFQKSAEQQLLEFDKHANERVDTALMAALKAREAELSDLTMRMRKETADAVIEVEQVRKKSEESAAEIERTSKLTISRLEANAAAASQTLQTARDQFLARRDFLLGQLETSVSGLTGPNRELVGSKPPGSASGLLAQAALTLIGVKPAIDEAGSGAPIKVALLVTGVSKQALSGESLAGRIVEGRSFVANESTDDKLGHGTQVASLVAAIAPQVQIVPIKVLSNTGGATDAQVLSGLDYAATVGARVVVLPLGSSGPCGPAYTVAFNMLRKRGALIVVAAGNSGSAVERPANCPGAFTITATDLQDKLPPFASIGPEVALAAPGKDIATIGLNGTFQQSGTSFAAAIAGGVAALVWSSRPDLTADDIETILKRSAAHLDVPANQVGAGRIDALAAVQLAKTYKASSN